MVIGMAAYLIFMLIVGPFLALVVWPLLLWLPKVNRRSEEIYRKYYRKTALRLSDLMKKGELTGPVNMICVCQVTGEEKVEKFRRRAKTRMPFKHSYP